MKSGDIIVLFGPDSSGKSTQVALLAKHLKKKHRVHTTSISIRHLVMFGVYKIFDKLGKKVQVGPNRFLPIMPKDRVRLLLEFVCTTIVILKVKLLKWLGYIVIIEKYTPFTIASLAYIYGPSVLRSFEAKMLTRFANGPCYIFLDLDYSTHLGRRGINSESLEWMEYQRRIYRHFARIVNCPTIDTGKIGVDETQSLIKQIIDNRLKA